MKKSKKRKDNLRVSREILYSKIRRRKKEFSKLYTLTKTKKGREKNFQLAFKIILTFHVKDMNELLQGMEVITGNRKKLKDLDKEFDSLYSLKAWAKRKKKNAPAKNK